MPVLFPIFPLDVQVAIIKKINIQVLLMLSTLSENMYRIIQFANIRFQEAVVEMSDENPFIAVGNLQTTNCVCFRPLSHEHYVRDPDLPSSEIEIDGVRLKCVEDSSTCFISALEETPEAEIWERLFKYLISLFRVEKYDVSISQYPISNGYLWEYTKNLANLYVCVQETALTGEDLEFLFNELTVETIRIQSAVAQEVEYKKPLTNGLVIVHNATWLKFNAIFFSSTPKIWLAETTKTFSAAKINALLKYWMGGGLSNLEHFEIRAVHRPNLRYSRGYRERMLSGIETREWDGNRRPRRYCCLNMTYGRDMVRDDGKLATVLLDRKMFLFFVWPEDYTIPSCRVHN